LALARQSFSAQTLYEIDSCVKIRSDLIVREVNGETVILDLSAGHLHTLNATASFVWHQLDGRQTVQDIAQAVSRMFNVDIKVAEKDVTTVIARMGEQQLVQEDDAETGAGERRQT